MSNTGSPDRSGSRQFEENVRAQETGPSEARQGVKGHNARFVLAIGTIGALLGMGIAYLFFFA